MAISAPAIANLALGRIGIKKFITALSDSTQEAITCNQFYADLRDMLLKAMDWPFARRHASNMVMITVKSPTTWSASATYAIDDYVSYLATDASGRQTSTAYRSLLGSNTNQNPVTATTYWVPTRLDWAFIYTLPADFMALRSIQMPATLVVPNDTVLASATGAPLPVNSLLVLNHVPCEIALNDLGTARALYNNVQYAEMIYTAQITDPTIFTPDFEDLLAWRLAVEIAMPLAVSQAIRKDAADAFKMAFAEAFGQMNREMRELPQPDSEFILGRL